MSNKTGIKRNSVIAKLAEIGKELQKNKILFLMILPSVLLVFVFSYIPMGGTIVAFKNYNFTKGIFGSDWAGLRNFKILFSGGRMGILLRNTILYNTAFILIGTVVKIFFAVLIVEMCTRRYKKTMQSIMMLPHFISFVIVGGMAYNILNYEFGLLNQILTGLGLDKMDVYSKPGTWPFIVVGVNLWKTVGYGMVFYLSAITGISPELHDAARVDGCGIMQRIRYITLPMIKPTTCILLLNSLANILEGNMQLFYQLVGNNSRLFNATDVIDTYVYRSLTQLNDFGVTGAATLFQNGVGFLLVITVNHIIKKYDESSALF